MNSNGILYMTVDDKGTISLWETPQRAAEFKKPNEVQVQLSLTKTQMATVIRAEMIAKQNKETKR